MIAYFGFLRDRNVGDEMVFWAARKLFPQCSLVPIKRRSPVGILALRNMFGEKLFRGIIVGGGTLIGRRELDPDLIALMSFDLPLFFHGTGIANGEPNPVWNDAFASSNGGVRGPVSVSYRAKLNCKNYVGDAAIQLMPEMLEMSKQLNSNRVLLNLGTHVDYDRSQRSHVEEQMVELIGKIIDAGLKPCFLPMHFIDVRRGEELLEKSNGALELLDQPRVLADVAREFKDCVGAIGERLHFVIAACISNRPFFSISYATKHADFLESCGLQDRGCSPGEFSAQSSLEKVLQSDSLPNSAMERLEELRQIQIFKARNFLSSTGIGRRSSLTED